MVAKFCCKSQGQPLPGVRNAAMISISRPMSREGFISRRRPVSGASSHSDRQRDRLAPLGRVDDAHIDRLAFRQMRDRKSTRLNSSHANISYAVFCLKKKKAKNDERTKRDENVHSIE